MASPRQERAQRSYFVSPCQLSLKRLAAGVPWPLQTSSTRKDLPTAKAARRRVERVTDGFLGSSNRSSWRRSVFMRAAIAVLVRPLSLIASADLVGDDLLERKLFGLGEHAFAVEEFIECFVLGNSPLASVLSHQSTPACVGPWCWPSGYCAVATAHDRVATARHPDWQSEIRLSELSLPMTRRSSSFGRLSSHMRRPRIRSSCRGTEILAEGDHGASIRTPYTASKAF